jgi:hypothetical protein
MVSLVQLGGLELPTSDRQSVASWCKCANIAGAEPIIEFEGSVATHHGWRLTLDAEWTPRRPIGLPLQKSAQARMIACRRSKLSVRR